MDSCPEERQLPRGELANIWTPIEIAKNIKNKIKNKVSGEDPPRCIKL